MSFEPYSMRQPVTLRSHVKLDTPTKHKIFLYLSQAVIEKYIKHVKFEEVEVLRSPLFIGADLSSLSAGSQG